MKQFSLLAAAFVALLSGLVTAHPGHGAAAAARYDERDLMAPRAVLNGTTGEIDNGTSADAEDHIPVFKTATCVCPPAVCDSRMNAKSQCQCRAQALLACYMQSAGGCPEPAEDTC